MNTYSINLLVTPHSELSWEAWTGGCMPSLLVGLLAKYESKTLLVFFKITSRSFLSFRLKAPLGLDCLFIVSHVTPCRRPTVPTVRDRDNNASQLTDPGGSGAYADNSYVVITNIQRQHVLPMPNIVKCLLYSNLILFNGQSYQLSYW